MEIISSQIPEIKIIVPKIFADNRGYFLESFRADLFKEAGIDIDFIQDNISKSSKGTFARSTLSKRTTSSQTC